MVYCVLRHFAMLKNNQPHGLEFVNRRKGEKRDHFSSHTSRLLGVLSNHSKDVCGNGLLGVKGCGQRKGLLGPIIKSARFIIEEFGDTDTYAANMEWWARYIRDVRVHTVPRMNPRPDYVSRHTRRGWPQLRDA